MPLFNIDPDEIYTGTDFSRNILAVDANRRAQEQHELQMQRNELTLQRQQDLMERPITGIDTENPDRLVMPETGMGPPMPATEGLSLQQRADRASTSMDESRALQMERLASEENFKRERMLEALQVTEQLNGQIQFLMQGGDLAGAESLYNGILGVYEGTEFEPLIMKPSEENFRRMQEMEREKARKLGEMRGISRAEEQKAIIDELNREEDPTKRLQLQNKLFGESPESKWWNQKAEKNEVTRQATLVDNVEDIRGRMERLKEKDEKAWEKMDRGERVARALGEMQGFNSLDDLVEAMDNNIVIETKNRLPDLSKKEAEGLLRNYRDLFSLSLGSEPGKPFKLGMAFFGPGFQKGEKRKDFDGHYLMELINYDTRYAELTGMDPSSYSSIYTKVATSMLFEDQKDFNKWLQKETQSRKNSVKIGK